MNRQQGQTLIETLVAAFILIMGISAALGLASYSLGATTTIRQQIIGMGLAREGIEAVKNMRDTNWLRAELSSDCFNFDTSENTAFCYRDWLNPNSGKGYDLSGAATQSFALGFSSQESVYWYLIPTSTQFGLDVPVAGTTDINGAWYSPRNGIPTANGTSGFARKITIAYDSSFAPFDTDTGPRLKVTSEVWWLDKGCPLTNTPPNNNRCAVKLETYLTNWKNF